MPHSDQVREPKGVQPHVEEAVKATMEEHAEGVAERCSGVQFCVECGMVDHVASQCTENPVSDDLAFSRWAETEVPSMATQDIPVSGDDRVLVLRPADIPAMSPSFTVTCDDKQVPTSLEPTSFDPQGRTLISIHLMLAVERKQRPNLTLRELWLKLAANPNFSQIDVKRSEEW